MRAFQRRMMFGFVASLAEFERELIRGRTQAGLKSARARGRKGGRPKVMSQEAIEKAAIAEALYKNGSIPVKKIAEQLGISKQHYIYVTFALVKKLRRTNKETRSIISMLTPKFLTINAH